MFKKARRFLGMTVAVILMLATFMPIMIYKVTKKIFSKKQSVRKYLFQIAVSTSQYYAAFLFETEDWTTSSRAWYDQIDSFKVFIFRAFIDLLLGKGHCENSFKNERKEIKLQGEQL